MGTPAVVRGDRITGGCVKHVVPGPSGSPVPSPGPLPFSAPVSSGLATTVFIGGKPAAVQGSSGTNDPPHTGLHPGDPFFAAPAQQGRVIAGSGTVFFDGRPAAFTGCEVAACAGDKAQIAGSAATVLVAR
jgi:uncharacterized Zn-binding protein involved in type VI secretion